MLQHNPKQERPELRDVCVYGSKQPDEFVGLRYNNGELKVYFPFGLSKPADDEKEYRKDILNLISILKEYSKEHKDFEEASNLNQEEVQFPIYAYIYVFNYFLKYGYYVESEPVYKKSLNGKINWPRTVKQLRPYILGNTPNEYAIYLNYITKKSNNNENEIISQIHKYCVYESYEKIGNLFEYFQPERPNIPFNAKLFTAVLKNKISKTFNEKHILLFRNMLDIICYLGTKNDNRSAFFGTKDFEYVWEGLIDDVFGINEREKRKYFPYCSWVTKEEKINADEIDEKKTALRPDTIMLSSRNYRSANIFILDAKYYQYGKEHCEIGEKRKRDKSKLPGTNSIIKQIAYAEFIDKMRKKEKKKGGKRKNKLENSFPKGKIYNTFILPYADNKGKKGYALECFGYAKCDWKDSDAASYHKIYGIFLDVRSIMQRHPTSSNNDIRELATLIERESKKI